MKQKDIVLIVVVAIVAASLSFFVSKKVFSSDADRAVQVKTVEAISTEFKSPDKKYFNDQSINPTKTITIGDNPSQQPTTPQPSAQR